jgi:hypothetical protein
MEELKDLTIFDKNLTGLFKVLKAVINTHEKYNLKLSTRANPILVRLEKYIKAHEKTEPDCHVWYFRQIYDKNRVAILRGPDADSWLIDGKIIIQYGSDVGIRNDIKIHLSAIYSTACTLKDKFEKEMTSLPSSDTSDELVFPSICMLHLYRIFYEIIDKDDEKERIKEYISELEGETGIKSSKSTKSSSSGKGKSEDGFGSIIDMATGFMEQMGVKLPEGQKLPSQDEIMKSFGQMMNNPTTKNMIGSVMNEIQGGNIKDVLGNLGKTLGSIDPGTANIINQNIEAATGEDTDQGYEEDVGAYDEYDGDFADGDEFLDE